MRTSFSNGQVLVDGELRSGLTVMIEDGVIQYVGPEPCIGELVDLKGGILAPGFIDTQVNGGGNVLFNDAPTVDTIERIGQAHRRFGTTGFLPTLISDDMPVIQEAITAVQSAIARAVPGVLGIHIEGPFLNVERRGIHLASKIQTLDADVIDALTRLEGGRTLITLAPEKTSPDLIRALVRRGAIVAAGHTDATYEEGSTAIQAGVTGATHLFNAMSPLGNREPGMVGAVLDSDAVTAGIIVDGRHVSPATLRIAMRARSYEAFMLVTDAMPSVGGADEFWLQGKRIRVEDGVCVDEQGTLAGSDLDMVGAVRNAIDLLHLPLPAALAMASSVPARFLGLKRHGSIGIGNAASLVWLSDALEVKGVWIDGICRASSPSQA